MQSESGDNEETIIVSYGTFSRTVRIEKEALYRFNPCYFLPDAIDFQIIKERTFLFYFDTGKINY
jgi:hypothetical protein